MHLTYSTTFPGALRYVTSVLLISFVSTTSTFIFSNSTLFRTRYYTQIAHASFACMIDLAHLKIFRTTT
jgi:hypothetical protein